MKLIDLQEQGVDITMVYTKSAEMIELAKEKNKLESKLAKLHDDLMMLIENVNPNVDNFLEIDLMNGVFLVRDHNSLHLEMEEESDG